MTPAGPRAVAADLGQTKIMIGIVDADGRTEELTTIPTPKTRTEILDVLSTHISRRFDQATRAIGIAAAPLVEPGTGRFLWAGSLPLEGVDLGGWLADRLKAHVIVMNDANAAAIGEHRAGAGRGTRHMIQLTLGTGIGGGIIIDGQLYVGAGGSAGELGHMTLTDRGPACSPGCDGIGHLEGLASGSAIGALVQERARANPQGKLAAAANSEGADARLVVRLARAGDVDATEILTTSAEWLGFGIANLVNIFNPETVVINGGLAAAGDLLLGPARRIVASHALEPSRSQVNILIGELGTQAGLVGAGLCAIEVAA